jgi:hypothetical protein
LDTLGNLSRYVGVARGPQEEREAGEANRRMPSRMSSRFYYAPLAAVGGQSVLEWMGDTSFKIRRLDGRSAAEFKLPPWPDVQATLSSRTSPVSASSLGVLGDRSGRFWIQVPRSEAAAGELWAVISPTGALRARVELPPACRLRAVGRQHMVCIVPAASDGWRVDVYSHTL